MSRRTAGRLAVSVGIVAASAAYVGWVQAGREGGLGGFASRLVFLPGPPAPEILLDGTDASKVTLAAPASSEAQTASGAAAETPASANPTTAQSGPRLYDGFYAGQAYYVTYGIVQVRIWVTGGKIVQLDTPYYPHDRYVSAEISFNVLPALETEVVKGHRTDIDIVTGATLTTTGYRLSLLDAVHQAQNGQG